MEGQEPGGTDPLDLQAKGATGSCREQRTPQIDSNSSTFDRHEEFVASDSISWRQGKFS